MLKRTLDIIKRGKKPMRAAVLINETGLFGFKGKRLTLDELQTELDQYECIDAKPNIILDFSSIDEKF